MTGQWSKLQARDARSPNLTHRFNSFFSGKGQQTTVAAQVAVIRH